MSKTPSAVQKSEGGTLDKAIEEMRSALHEEAQPNMDAEKTGFLVDIPVELQIVLGSAEMTVSELMALQRGSTVSLDRRIGEPVEIMVNGRLIARGEITILENDPSRFGVRLTEIGGSIKAE